MVRGADGLKRLQALYEAKALAEISAVAGEPAGTAFAGFDGDPMAAVALVTGERAALPETTRIAAGKALEALGFDPRSVCVLHSQSMADVDEVVRTRRLRGLVESVDPVLVIAIDPPGARDVERAFDTEALRPGVPRSVGGHWLGAIGDLGASLADVDAKSAVWAAFRAVAVAVPAPIRSDGPRPGVA